MRLKVDVIVTGIASRPGFISPCQKLRRVKSVRPNHPASAPARTYDDQRAEQPIAAGNRRLTRASNQNEPTIEEVQA